MRVSEERSLDRMWCCLHCRGPLTLDGTGLDCPGCGRRYPVISGIPILVRDPAGYLRSELASLTQASQLAKQRRELLAQVKHDAALPQQSLDRHEDVIAAEISQAEMLLALLEPAAQALETLAESGKDAPPRRAGWAFDTLLPYLIRDWSNTAELDAAKSLIGTALSQIFPDPAGKTVAVAGCGAGGLLAGIPPGFERVVGYDLTLPILAAARHLLDGQPLHVPLPRAIHEQGGIALCARDPALAGAPAILAAMDAFDTGFADGALDCVITSFLIDLISDPRKLAEEIYRILAPGGVWINYGPSGPLKAFWRFDNEESAAFFETVGFAPIRAEAHRTTYLDLSRDCPSWSSRNHMCYLTAARKTELPREKPKTSTPDPAPLAEIVPRHFPAANLIQRQSLGADRARAIVLRFERLPGKMESVDISADDVRILALVDGKKTVREIADVLSRRSPAQPEDETMRVFARYFERGLLRG